jgi:hypothetical protein
MKKTKRFYAAGLFLWSVKVKEWSESLWITTKRNDFITASLKARKVARKYAKRHGRASCGIASMDFNGSIDG